MSVGSHFVLIRQQQGLVPYLPTYQAMQNFTKHRDDETFDEIWLLEHGPVYTLGQTGRREHLIHTGNIPVHVVDRGGQVTYHGPGQLVAYVLMDVKRRHWTIKQLVYALEQAVIDYLTTIPLRGERRDRAPGIYIQGQKLSSLGLRISRGCSYHGLSLNIDMDLSPFSGINPCGYTGLRMTQLHDLGINQSVRQITLDFLPYLLSTLDYSSFVWTVH